MPLTLRMSETDDREPMQMLGPLIRCEHCGSVEPIKFADTLEYVAKSGMKFWRLRVRFFCHECQLNQTYRICGPVIEHGECLWDRSNKVEAVGDE